MHPNLRTALGVIAATIVAAYLGWQIAEGAYGLPALFAGVIVTVVLVQVTGLTIDAIVICALFVGFIVGNRGFAQLMPHPQLPLLPAEIGLVVVGGWQILRCAFERRLPFRRDALNWAILAWLVVGAARLPFDVPQHGLLAIRDSAMNYYAVFFFLTQDVARDDRSRALLTRTVLLSCLVAAPVFALFQAFQPFFLNQLTVRGTPLIYHKDDLTVSFIAIGTLLLFYQARGRYRGVVRAVCMLLFLYVASGENRASIVGMFAAGGLLLVGGRWRYFAALAATSLAGLLAVVTLASVLQNPWANRKLDGLSDRVTSVFDVQGTGTYKSQDSYFKGDNNRFRFVWWRNVVEDTWNNNPVFGLGFGADISQGFVQEYYPDATEEFNTRSPHNIAVTAFGRLGLVGLAIWTAVLAMLLRHSWRGIRHSPDPTTWGLWASPWVLVVSASLGVVLEGPMGAVVFWSLLGLANATSAEEEEQEAAPAVTGEAEPVTPELSGRTP